MRPRATSPMRAGDIVRCDFGTPARGEPGFVRPAIVVTCDDVLEFRQHAIVVVPCTTTRRGWLSEVDVTGFGVAQAHLPTTISVDRVVETTGSNIGPVALQQVREMIADLLGLEVPGPPRGQTPSAVQGPLVSQQARLGVQPAAEPDE